MVDEVQKKIMSARTGLKRCEVEPIQYISAIQETGASLLVVECKLGVEVERLDELEVVAVSDNVQRLFERRLPFRSFSPRKTSEVAADSVLKSFLPTAEDLLRSQDLCGFLGEEDSVRALVAAVVSAGRKRDAAASGDDDDEGFGVDAAPHMRSVPIGDIMEIKNFDSDTREPWWHHEGNDYGNKEHEAFLRKQRVTSDTRKRTVATRLRVRGAPCDFVIIAVPETVQVDSELRNRYLIEIEAAWHEDALEGNEQRQRSPRPEVQQRTLDDVDGKDDKDRKTTEKRKTASSAKSLAKQQQRQQKRSHLEEVLESLNSLLSMGTEKEIYDAAADLVHRISGFERVMVYMFDPRGEDFDGWGEVVAEALRQPVPPKTKKTTTTSSNNNDESDEDSDSESQSRFFPLPESFYGRKFPASDVPRQARALYKRNQVRSLVDVDAAPVPLKGRDGRAIDLSDTRLRLQSPVHQVYMKNMGVRATASTSIVVDGKLVGFISCHECRGPRAMSTTMWKWFSLIGVHTSMAVSAIRSRRKATLLGAIQRQTRAETVLGTFLQIAAPTTKYLDAAFCVIVTIPNDAAVTMVNVSRGDADCHHVDFYGEATADQVEFAVSTLFASIKGDCNLTETRTLFIDDLALPQSTAATSAAISAALEKKKEDDANADSGNFKEVLAEDFRRSADFCRTANELQIGGIAGVLTNNFFLGFVRKTVSKNVNYAINGAHDTFSDDAKFIRAKQEESIQQAGKEDTDMTDAKPLLKKKKHVDEGKKGGSDDEDKSSDARSSTKRPRRATTTTKKKKKKKKGASPVKDEDVDELLFSADQPASPEEEDEEEEEEEEEEKKSSFLIQLRPSESFKVFDALHGNFAPSWSSEDREIVTFIGAWIVQASVYFAVSIERDRAVANETMARKFLANMSHELRTPFNGVVGMLSVLLEDESLPEEAQRMLNVVNRSAESMLTLLDDILAISKLENKEFRLIRVSFSIENVMCDIVELFRARCAEANITIESACEVVDELAFPRGAPTLVSDGGRIRQVLVNIVSNAIKFSHVDSTISIKIALHSDNAKMLIRSDIERAYRKNTNAHRNLETLFEEIDECMAKADADDAHERTPLTPHRPAVARKLTNNNNNNNNNNQNVMPGSPGSLASNSAVENAAALPGSSSSSIISHMRPNKTKAERLWMLVSVTDRGIGISQRAMSKLFRRFSQVDDSKTRMYQGTGLGLAICEHLIALMGGRIWCFSSDGDDSKTTFQFLLPVGVDREATYSPSASNPKNSHVVSAGELETASVRRFQGNRQPRPQQQSTSLMRGAPMDTTAANDTTAAAALANCAGTKKNPSPEQRQIVNASSSQASAAAQLLRLDESTVQASLANLRNAARGSNQPSTTVPAVGPPPSPPVRFFPLDHVFFSRHQQAKRRISPMELAKLNEQGQRDLAKSNDLPILLAVDDIETNRAVLAVLLQSQSDYHIMLAEDGLAAVNAWNEFGERIKAIILDWHM